MKINLALALTFLILPSLARAQNNEVEPCGTVVKSIRLKKDCSAPMVIGANNITVNLNGHTIRNVPPGYDEEGRGGAEVIDRRGVTIKNGTVLGPRYGLLVQRGGEHTFRNLDVKAEAESGNAVRIEDVDHTLVKRITTTPRFDVPVFLFKGKHSTISNVTSRGDSAHGAFIRGEALLIANNDFKSGTGAEAACGLLFRGERSILRGNQLTTSATEEGRFLPGVIAGGLCVIGDDNLIKRNIIVGAGTGLALDSAAASNVIRNNSVTSDTTIVSDALDIRGGDNACANTWKNNDFETDSEGDGSDAGCIR